MKETPQPNPTEVKYTAEQVVGMVEDLELSRRMLATECHGELREFHEGRFEYLSNLLNPKGLLKSELFNF